MTNECITDVIKRRRKVRPRKQGIEEEILKQAESSGDISRLKVAMEKSNLDDIKSILQRIAGYAPKDYVTRVTIQEVASGIVKCKVGEPVAAIKPATMELAVPGKGLHLLKVEASPAADVESSFSAVWLGIEASGKSSLIERIRQGEFVAASSTIGLNVSSFVFEGMKLVNCDLSGHKSFRSIWDSLIVGNPDVIVYVVDASDSSTASEAKEVLANCVLRMDNLRGTPILIAYNKQDAGSVLTTEELNSKLGISDSINGRECKAIQTSAKSGVGIPDMLEWILQQIKAKKGVNAQ